MIIATSFFKFNFVGTIFHAYVLIAEIAKNNEPKKLQQQTMCKSTGMFYIVNRSTLQVLYEWYTIMFW